MNATDYKNCVLLAKRFCFSLAVMGTNYRFLEGKSGVKIFFVHSKFKSKSPPTLSLVSKQASKSDELIKDDHTENDIRVKEFRKSLESENNIKLQEFKKSLEYENDIKLQEFKKNLECEKSDVKELTKSDGKPLVIIKDEPEDIIKQEPLDIIDDDNNESDDNSENDIRILDKGTCNRLPLVFYSQI